MLNTNLPLSANTSATTSTTEELNSLSMPQATRPNPPILPSGADDASQLSRASENTTNISIDSESPNLEHSSFFTRNYNESLIRLLSSNGHQAPDAERRRAAGAPSMLNSLFKSLSGSILSSIQKPFQSAAASGNQTAGGPHDAAAASHTCSLGYRLSANLSDADLNRTAIEPLIEPQTDASPHYFSSSRYQAFTNDSPSFSASSNNFSFVTVNTVSTGLTSDGAGKLPSTSFPQTATGEEPVHGRHAGVTKSCSAPGGAANLLNNNIFKLNLDNLGDEQNPFNMCGGGGNASLSSKQLTIYEKRYLLAVELGDLAGV